VTDGSDTVQVVFSVPLMGLDDITDFEVDGDDPIAILTSLPATIVNFQYPSPKSAGMTWDILNASTDWHFATPGIVSPTSGITT